MPARFSSRESPRRGIRSSGVAHRGAPARIAAARVGSARRRDEAARERGTHRARARLLGRRRVARPWWATAHRPAASAGRDPDSMMYRRIVRGEKRLMAQRDPLENPEPLIRRVYSYVAYRIGDGADAEDVTSATFERALRYRHSYDEQRGEPAAWLIGIAARCVSELYAQRAPPVAEAVEGVAPGELAAEAPERIDLQRAVATL